MGTKDHEANGSVAHIHSGADGAWLHSSMRRRCSSASATTRIAAATSAKSVSPDGPGRAEIEPVQARGSVCSTAVTWSSCSRAGPAGGPSAGVVREATVRTE
eukprot:scaffold10488_cov78-Phaeocystis_antarctica.AAC.4